MLDIIESMTIGFFVLLGVVVVVGVVFYIVSSIASIEQALVVLLIVGGLLPACYQIGQTIKEKL